MHKNNHRFNETTSVESDRMNCKIWHVGIYEPHFDGHRLKYVQYLIKRLIDIDDVNITLFTFPDTLKSEQFATHLSHYAAKISIRIISAHSMNELLRSANDCHTDLIVVPDGDSLVWKYLWRTGWQGPGRLAVLVMRPTGQGNNIIQKFFNTAMKQSLIIASRARKKVSIYELSSALKTDPEIPFIVPDPISFAPDEDQLSDIWPSTNSTRRNKWIGAVGALSERKNVPLILQAATNVKRSNFGIVLAGSIDARTREAIQAPLQALQKRNVPIVVIDQIMTDGQLDAVIKRLHGVVLAHSNEGPSGILGKAVEGGTLVIAAGAHSLKRDCKQINHMSRWSPLDSVSITQSIESMLDSDRPSPAKLGTEFTFANRLLDMTAGMSDRC